MYNVALFGAGKIGEAICALLSAHEDYTLKICDISGERARFLASLFPRCTGYELDLSNDPLTTETLRGCHAVISALPYHCNEQVAQYAAKAGIHYLDLTEDVETTKKVSALAKGSASAFIPQAGLAPGFISIAAASLMKLFEVVDSVKLRVGALPIYPSNQLKYNLTWSTEGLINEYGNMCEIVVNGSKMMAFPLEGLESFYMMGDVYEAFNTSGGLGSLCETYVGKLKNLDYKSVRHVGHRDYIAFLMKELRFNEDRDTLRKVLERSLPTTHQDKCLIFVEVTGHQNTRFIQKTYASIIYNNKINGRHLSAIQLTTAAGVCTPLDLLLTGKLKNSRGMIKCEEISLIDFLNNRFGQHFKDEMALKGIE